MVLDEHRLIEKLRGIEALHAGAATAGEREAAACARERILERLKQREAIDRPIEYRFTLEDSWSRQLFTALLRRYGLRPYRYHRQRYTTVMVRVPATFVEETLWPEFRELDDTLREHLAEITKRVIRETIDPDDSDAETRDPALLTQ